ncbi:MAG: hypothetical protein UHM85_11060 [Acutalibacteraceae bacterium]|nr:hypothetical protein [Acutalibacteraceae bacterium]
MAKHDIFVPLLPWLIGGSRIGGSYNIYCASVGTDPQKGCIGTNIFNYRIWIEKLDETEIIKAAVYYGTKSYDSQNEDEIITETYEMSEESLPLIKAFLEIKAEEYLN